MSTIHTTTVYTTAPPPVYAAPPRHEEKILYQAPPQPQETVQSHSPHAWETSLFNCFTSFKSCCLACWCPCVIFGKTKHRLRNPNMDKFNWCNSSCLLHCICVTCLPTACCMQMRQRREIRKKYNLTGNCCDDCLRVCCCSCCELMQADNEVRAKKERTATAPSEAGYRRPDGMTYGP